MITISNSNLNDLPTIFEFYDFAVQHQKKVGAQEWKGFDQDVVRREISDHRQYKVEIDGQVACVFMVTFSDPEIWLERSKDKAIYLHRIVTHPDFRGLGFIKHITDWAYNYSKNNTLDFIRMDTWADNPKLVNYYKSFGYKDAGTIQITADSGLPKHYEGVKLQLFEIVVQ